MNTVISTHMQHTCAYAHIHTPKTFKKENLNKPLELGSHVHMHTYSHKHLNTTDIQIHIHIYIHKHTFGTHMCTCTENLEKRELKSGSVTQT